MGDVETTSKALERVMLTGSPHPILPLERFILQRKGTPNIKLMAVGAALNSPRSISDHISPSPFLQAAIDLADDILSDEERSGPRPKEVLCPDPHEGMYLYGRIGIIVAGLAAPVGSAIHELGLRAAIILSQELRLADLIATPDGDCTGLPGMRAPNGAGLGRRALTNLRTIVRQRQSFDVVLRGPSGAKRKSLKWSDKSDRLIDGPAYWMQLTLNENENRSARFFGPSGLLDILSPTADLPKRLALPLTVHRWNGGTLSFLHDPGPEQRKRFIIKGSAAAKRDKLDHDEDPVDWVRVEWGKPGHHIVTAGSSWEAPVPLMIGHSHTTITIKGANTRWQHEMKRSIFIALLYVIFLLTGCTTLKPPTTSDSIPVVVHDHCADEISNTFIASREGYSYGDMSRECAQDMLFALNQSLSKGDSQ